jgi:hypothetical protein
MYQTLEIVLERKSLKELKICIGRVIILEILAVHNFPVCPHSWCVIIHLDMCIL